MTSPIPLLVLIGCIIYIHVGVLAKSGTRKIIPDDQDSGKVNKQGDTIQTAKGGSLVLTDTVADSKDEEEQEGGGAELKKEMEELQNGIAGHGQDSKDEEEQEGGGDDLKKTLAQLHKSIAGHGQANSQNDDEPGTRSILGQEVNAVVADPGSGFDALEAVDPEAGSGAAEPEDRIIKNRIRSVEVESGEGILLEGSGEMHNDQHRETENTQTRRGTSRTRTKRLAITGHRWPKGIVPYDFSSTMTDGSKADALAVMSFYEKHTCLKYVPKSEAAQYNLGHWGYLNYKKLSSCWSLVGNTNKAQTISCCGRTLCIHESAHALGLLHEQQNNEREGFIRIEWQNIIPENMYNFMEVSTNVISFPYDFSSMMHYKVNSFSKNNKQTITKLIESPEFIVGGKYYYLLHQISEISSCRQLGKCEDIPCANDGYVTVKRGKCACVCPDGLEPSTGCTTPKMTAQISEWPPGTFALLKASGSCPPDFQEGSVRLEGNGKNSVSPGLHLSGVFSSKSHEYEFCVQAQSSGSQMKWEAGNYCINKYGETCPEGFSSGTITVSGLKGGDNSHSGEVPAGNFGDDSTFEYCCRQDGITFDPIILPSKDAFAMYPSFIGCQEVEGMYSRDEYYAFDAVAVKTEGMVPGHTLSDGTRLAMRICYYMPIKYDCGGVIDMTADSPTHSFSSPGFGESYPNGIQCTWLFKGPKDSKLVLDIEDFDIDKSSRGCSDYVEIRNMRVGHPGIKYCGKYFGRSILSTWNTVAVVFRSDDHGQAKGFKASVKMIPFKDLSYNVADSGASYNGKTNFTISSEACLPWREMSMCRHYSTKPDDLGDNLDDNYCRNPGHGFQPWCYIQKTDCIRNYCDVSGIGRIFDANDNCAKQLSLIPDMCSDKILAMGCMRTCQDSLHLPTPTKMESCSKPGQIPGASLESSKDSYSPGEKVKYACTTDKGTTLDITCLTDGTWSPGGYVCGDCQTGWMPFQGYCYKYFSDRVSYATAQATCKQHNNGVVASTETEKEQELVASIREPTVNTWTSLTKVDWKWKWGGVRSLGFRKWAAGEPWTKESSPKWINHVYMLGIDAFYAWKPTGAWAKWPLVAFVCKTKPTSQRSTCVDRRTNCAHEINEMPTICQEEKTFAWIQCPKSCGMCDQSAAGKCTVPSLSANAVHVSGGSELNQGEVVTYKCAEGFALTDGNLQRACLDGQLTGKEPVCTDINTMVTLTSPVELAKRKYIPGNYRMYIGGGEEFQISRSGEITKFKFYSLETGRCLIQVYRPVEGDTATMRLIANYYVVTHTDRQEIFYVPEHRRVKVEPGDRLALWYDQTRGGICYDSCTDASKTGLQSKSLVYWPSNFNVGNEYEFTVNTKCQTFSFRAEIGPAK